MTSTIIIQRILLDAETVAARMAEESAAGAERSAVAQFALDAMKAALREAALGAGQDLLVQGILIGKGDQHGLNWRSLETSAALMKEVAVREWRGASQGVSFRVAKGVRYRVGSSPTSMS